MKESYIKLPNITTSKLQDVVDYLGENNIEYIEEYKRDEEIERLNNRITELEKGVSRKEEQITNLDDENFDLENEIERLNNIINKGIEYIKSVGVLPKQIDSFVLLEILKGSDKE